MPADVLNRQRKMPILRERVEEIAAEILQAVERNDEEWVVTLVSDRKMTPESSVPWEEYNNRCAELSV